MKNLYIPVLALLGILFAGGEVYAAAPPAPPAPPPSPCTDEQVNAIAICEQAKKSKSSCFGLACYCIKSADQILQDTISCLSLPDSGAAECRVAAASGGGGSIWEGHPCWKIYQNCLNNNGGFNGRVNTLWELRECRDTYSCNHPALRNLEVKLAGILAGRIPCNELYEGDSFCWDPRLNDPRRIAADSDLRAYTLQEICPKLVAPCEEAKRRCPYQESTPPR